MAQIVYKCCVCAAAGWLAAHLKQNTQASNHWLCEQLHMGTPVGVSQMVGVLRRQGGPAARLLDELTEKPKT